MLRHPEYNDYSANLILCSGRPIAEVSSTIKLHKVRLGKSVTKVRMMPK